MPFKTKLDGPIGGEAWAKPERTMPYDRPPQFADMQQALDFVFKRLRQPVMTKKLLNLLQIGMPIDVLVEGMLMQGFTEGKYGAPIIHQMVAPLVVILWRMAESAGIQPMLSTDKNPGQDFDPADMQAAQQRIGNNTANKAIMANKISDTELKAPNMADKQGFMKFRPKPKSRIM